MDYEDMIEDEPKPAAEPTELEVEGLPEEPRAKSPWRAFILTGLLAGLIGAAGGSYGAYASLKHFSPEPVVQADVDLSPLEAKLERLTQRVSAAESDFKRAANQSPPEIEPLELSALEARLEALESAPMPDIDPEALTALQAVQEDGFEWPDVSAIEARIAALEMNSDSPAETELPDDLMSRLSALESEIETMKTAEPVTIPVMDEDMMSEMDARLSALENRPAPTPVVERVSILAFPKARLAQAVEDNRSGGMIEKTLSRHIRVKDANDPLTLIDGIEADLSNGQLAAAAEKFERLPSPVRAAGQAWYDSVKAIL